MTDFVTLILATAAGLVLGVFFFGGLWWTVRRATASPHPAAWFICSFLLRMVLVLSGFYYAGGSQWSRWMVCLVGFIVARVIVSRMTRPPVAPQAAPTEETRHAS